MKYESPSVDRANCERVASEFRRLEATRRSQDLDPAELSVESIAHVASCSHCATHFGDVLFAASPRGDVAPIGGTPSLGSMPRRDRSSVHRLVRLVHGFAASDRERFRERLEELLVLRALRCVAAYEGRAERERAGQREHAAAEALDSLLIEFCGFPGHWKKDASPASELHRLAFDFSDSDASYEALRRIEVLVPRPPRLPRPGDWVGRERVLLWAASLRSF